MKNFLASVLFLIVIIGASYAFGNDDEGIVIGTVSPMNAGDIAWLIAGADTLRADIRENAFGFPGVKKGTYSLLIQAMPMYKNAIRTNVVVTEGNTTNVGEIHLGQ